MIRTPRLFAIPAALGALLAFALPGVRADEKTPSDVLAPIYERYAADSVEEVPSLQRHVVPLMGRLGCNGRACHGSFQGRGGFQLSLFGYDFKADHDALTDSNAGRVMTELPEESLIVVKPTDEALHEGGKRFEAGGWEQKVFLRWIEGGASFDEGAIEKLVELQVEPSELIFEEPGKTVSLRAIAVWEDGTREDVTSLCRFQSNDDAVATIDREGAVTSVGKGDTHVVVFYDKAVVPIPTMMAVSDLVGDRYPKVETRTKIDELAVEKMAKLGVVPSGVCDDATFLRRVRLDLTGTLPSVAEVESFLADTSPEKRTKKIDELLETPEYAAWWATKFSDWTGNNDRLLNGTLARGNSSKEWHDWLRVRIAANVSYDKIVEEILVADAVDDETEYREWCAEASALYMKDAERSFEDQESMPYFWARTNVRAKEDKTIAVAYSFLGIRIQCAQCHKHPFDQWSKDDFEQFTKFFERVNYRTSGAGPLKPVYEEILKEAGFDPKTDKGNQLQKKLPDVLAEGKVVPIPYIGIEPVKTVNSSRKVKGKTVREKKPDPKASTGRLLGAETVNLVEVDDPRQPVMDWLRDPANPFFAKAIANRVWASYFHRGLVEPSDDLNLANPPSNAGILDHLATGFVQHDFDLKWLHREIANSDTYQRSWETNETNALDKRNFSHAVLRRLPAEAAYDAVYLASLSDEVREETSKDLGKRAISFSGVQNGGGSKASSFALSVFGKSLREQNCDCDRSGEPNLLQTCFLQNDQEALAMIDQKGGWVSQLERRWGTGSDEEEEARKDDERKQANLETQLARAKKALREAEKKDDEAKASRAKKQIRNVEKQLAEIEERLQGDVEVKQAAFEEDLDRTIEVAYLRTLSRHPTEEEQTVSRAYFAESEDPGDAVRGLLWALINTKEFIVNH